MCVPQVYSASCSSDELLQVLKNEGLTDLLFLALLVGKESSGAWQEALQMFRWMQKVEEKAGREAGLQEYLGEEREGPRRQQVVGLEGGTERWT